MTTAAKALQSAVFAVNFSSVLGHNGEDYYQILANQLAESGWAVVTVRELELLRAKAARTPELENRLELARYERDEARDNPRRIAAMLVQERALAFEGRAIAHANQPGGGDSSTLSWLRETARALRRVEHELHSPHVNALLPPHPPDWP